jgi:hypothetical protein
MSEGDHFVYLYRDARGHPVYVGRGQQTGRVISPHPHNPELMELLEEDEKHTVEIAGPLGSKEAADKLETALISAIKETRPLAKFLLNKNEVNSKYRFRKLAVPVNFADRDGHDLLHTSYLDVLVRKLGGPLLFVNINDKNFKNKATRGFDPAKPPENKYVLERFEKWWPLRKIHDERWSKQPRLSPRILIGLFGKPEAKIVIGAVRIDSARGGRWNCREEEHFGPGGRMRVPVQSSNDLDEMKLRGRKVAAKEAGLLFGRLKHQLFHIYPAQD